MSRRSSTPSKSRRSDPRRSVRRPVPRLVVGAGSGIGEAIASGLATFGATVICADSLLDAATVSADGPETGGLGAGPRSARSRRAGRVLDHRDPRYARDDPVDQRAQAHRRLHRRRARSSRRPQHQRRVPPVPHVRRGDGRGRTGLDDRVLVHSLADHRARPGRVRSDQGGDRDAVQDPRRRAREAGVRANVIAPGSSRRRSRLRSATTRTGTGPTPTSRSCAAGRSPANWSAPRCTSHPTPRATSPARRCSSTAAGPPPTAATPRASDPHRASDSRHLSVWGPANSGAALGWPQTLGRL